MPGSHTGSVHLSGVESLSRKIAHCLVEMSFTVFCGGQEADDLPLRELEGGGMVLMRRGNDRSAAGGSKAC